MALVVETISTQPAGVYGRTWSDYRGTSRFPATLKLTTTMTKTTMLGAATAMLILFGCKKTEDAQPTQYGTIGDLVWTDVNANGQQDAGEAPLSGVKVVLYDGAGTRKLDSTTTSSAGTYLYDKLTSGTYKLRFTAPTAMVATTAAVGNDATDSDINSLGWSQTVSIDVAKAVTDTMRVNRQVDAGFRAQTSFAKDVNALLVASCSPCHVEGSGANFAARVKHVNNYTNAKAIGAAILDRVSRAQGATGMMPRNGTRLSNDKIALIKKWVDEGLGE